jgi:erythronate-4-phosphate dehydrogenase
MIMTYKATCEYFGIKAKFDIKDFLPEPGVPQLKISVENSDEQKVLLQAVEEIYKIGQDDSKLRQILNVPAEKKGKYFSDLRKNYPVRREFHNTKIIFNLENKVDLAEKFRGIGFKTQNET